MVIGKTNSSQKQHNLYLLIFWVTPLIFAGSPRHRVRAGWTPGCSSPCRRERGGRGGAAPGDYPGRRGGAEWEGGPTPGAPDKGKLARMFACLPGLKQTARSSLCRDGHLCQNVTSTFPQLEYKLVCMFGGWIAGYVTDTKNETDWLFGEIIP